MLTFPAPSSKIAEKNSRKQQLYTGKPPEQKGGFFISQWRAMDERSKEPMKFMFNYFGIRTISFSYASSVASYISTIPIKPSSPTLVKSTQENRWFNSHPPGQLPCKCTPDKLRSCPFYIPLLLAEPIIHVASLSSLA